MAKVDTLTEALYKLIHKLARNDIDDATIEREAEGMSFSEVCEKMNKEIEEGNLSIGVIVTVENETLVIN